MVYRMEGIRLALEDGDEKLKQAVAETLGIAGDRIANLCVVRRAIDARKNRPPTVVYIVDAETDAPVRLADKDMGGVTVKHRIAERQAAPDLSPSPRQMRPVVVGCGPAGLFAALIFSLHGLPVLLLERGKPIHERVLDVDAFWRQGVLDPESHVQFGEGGAGTFSDGKLTSRVKNPLAGWVKRTFVDLGAPPGILVDGKPHIGTDRLRHVMMNFRKRLMGNDCEFRFRSKMTDILVREGKVAGVIVNDTEEIQTDCLILACGQSADDTYGLLLDRGIRLEPKPFAMGLRIEHPQDLINAIQYGPWAKHPQLPPAEYFLTAKTREGDRSIYTFCMCPGGRVIGSSARPGGIATNGMSDCRRDGYYANSAVVVNVRTEDFRELSGSPLSGIVFRRRWEETAFALGGNNFQAPAERLLHFVDNKTSPDVGETTFSPGVRAVSLHGALPPFIVAALKEGFLAFHHKMHGFISQEANLIGIETRTSSPVRITRGPDGQSASLAGLYPCGEGAGYAGGIISSALDGIRAAQRAITG